MKRYPFVITFVRSEAGRKGYSCLMLIWSRTLDLIAWVTFGIMPLQPLKQCWPNLNNWFNVD
jgi:hypothetical protein